MNASNWSQFISMNRLRVSERGNATLAQVVGSDHGRVVFSSPFRRMQQKAQVFSLENNAAVRSRLTHSVEVSHIGRFIASEVVLRLGNKISPELVQAIPVIVEVSCLLHDIGNPPFGHLGEAAIQKWFSKWSNAKNLDKDLLQDFLEFDGNPQGFRIVTKLQGSVGEKGLNLTCSQLLAFLKYPISPTKLKMNDSKFKKAGYFSSEKNVYEDSRKALQMNAGVRHPLVYIMEAADDIAYSLSDIEDGVEKQLIDVDNAFNQILGNCKASGAKQLVENAIEYANKKSDERASIRIMRFRIKMINQLVTIATDIFVKDESRYLNGEASSIFEENTEAYDALSSIRKFVAKKIYCSREAEDIEISGFNIIHSLLNSFGCLLDLAEQDFSKLVIHDKEFNKSNPYEKRIFSRIPESLVLNYKHEIEQDKKNELFYRCHMIVDYICGMTDDFALQIHQLFAGIRVESV